MRLQSVQKGQNTGIGRGLILHIQQVVGPKIGQTAGFQLGWGILRNRPGDQLGHAVAHETAHLFQGPSGQSVEGKGVVGAVSQVLQRVEKSTVQIKNCSFICGHTMFLPDVVPVLAL